MLLTDIFMHAYSIKSLRISLTLWCLEGSVDLKGLGLGGKLAKAHLFSVESLDVLWSFVMSSEISCPNQSEAKSTCV